MDAPGIGTAGVEARIVRLRREAFLDGDLDAARALAQVSDRYGLGDGLKRRLARVLLDGGEPFSALSYSGSGHGDVCGILWWSDQDHGGRPVLTSPVEVPLCWGEREARGYLCDLGMRALESYQDEYSPKPVVERHRENIADFRRSDAEASIPCWFIAQGASQVVLDVVQKQPSAAQAWRKTLWRRAYRVNKAAREAMPTDDAWRRSRLLQYLLGEVRG